MTCFERPTSNLSMFAMTFMSAVVIIFILCRCDAHQGHERGMTLATDHQRERYDVHEPNPAIDQWEHTHDVPTRANLEVEELDDLPDNLCINVKVVYNTLWDEFMRSQQGMSGEEGARRAIAMANEVYNVGGLGTNLTLRIVGDPVFDDSPEALWEAEREDGWLFDPVLLRHVEEARHDINHYTFLTSPDHSRDRVLGVAYLHTMCYHTDEGQFSKVSINEFYRSWEQTSETIAHEIGHASNLLHDFDVDQDFNHVDRFGSDGRLCTSIGGAMDYGSSSDRSEVWTSCSRDSLLQYYRYQMMEMGSFCLVDSCSDDIGLDNNNVDEEENDRDDDVAGDQEGENNGDGDVFDEEGEDVKSRGLFDALKEFLIKVLPLF